VARDARNVAGACCKVKAHVNDRQDRLDAHLAANDADLAEDYALSAIDFAQATVDEAEWRCWTPCTHVPTRTRSAPLLVESMST